MEKEGLTPTPAAEQTFDNTTEVVENSINSLPESEPQAESGAAEVKETEPITKSAMSKIKTIFDAMIDDAEDLVEKISEKAEPMIESIKEKAEEISGKISEKAEPMIESIKEKAEEISEKISEKAEPMIESIKEKAEPMIESIKEKAEEISGKISEKAEPMIESIKEKAEEISGKISEKAEPMIESIKEKAEEISGKISEKAEPMIESIKEKAEEISGKISEKAEPMIESIKEKAEEISGKISEKAEPMIESIKEKAEEISEKISEKAEPMIESIKEKAQPIIDKISQKAEDIKNSFNKNEEENPASQENTEKDPSEISLSNEYTGKTKDELINILAVTISERPVQQIRTTVDAIKISFYKIHRAEIEDAKNAFVSEGNPVENFSAEADPLESRLKELIAEYRTKRDHYVANIETEKENNYKAKLAVIEELKELTSSNETLNNTFATFRELQNRWKEIGIVPQDKIKDLWDTYHHHVENFYNYVKINKELRDIDLKRNYEAKIILCEEAEALMLDPSATSAFHKLQKLHDQWRETGPVALEYKDQIWERFKEASTRINKRHQEYYDGIKEEQERNLKLKEELCTKVEELSAQPFTTRKEWGDASDQIAEIQKIWKTIGFAPKKDNTAIYERFRAACDKFFDAKRQFFGEIKNEMEDNLQVKTDLCMQAEALAESEDWKAATEAIIELQKKWKESGAVARKHADEVWKRFRGACDRFFERKSEHFNNIDSKFTENLESKKQLLKELTEALEDKANLTFDKLKEYQRRWSEIGFVPIKQKEAIAKQYKEVIDGIFSILRSGEGERRMERFKEKVTNFKEGGRVSSERDKLYNKVRQIEADIQVWENNIGFFAKSKNAEALVKEVEKKIEKAKAEIAELVEKIKVIDNA